MLKEYKEFLFRGNLLDLAVAFILGVAFSAVVSSLANDVIMELVAGLFGLEGIEAMELGPMRIGLFLSALLYFVIVATALFFLMRAAKRFQRAPVEETPVETDEVILLREIRDALRGNVR
jgi:large conductance mechanosensitive channel